MCSRLAHALLEVKDKVRFCSVCGNVAQQEQCNICRDTRRDTSVICVVEEPKDVVAIERTREFRGRYHVLGGAISPIEGVGPDDLRIRELLARLADGSITELILATDPNLEGEATATYLARMVKPMGLRVTRLASGLPVGGDLEYADEVTLGRAFEGGACSMSDTRTAPGVLPATVSTIIPGTASTTASGTALATAPRPVPATVFATAPRPVPATVFATAPRPVPATLFTTASPAVPATHGGFTFSDAMFYSPFATVPTGGPLDV